MTDENLDINNYTVSELLQIFGIDKYVEKKTLIELADDFIKQLKERKTEEGDEYANFLSKALNKILSNFDSLSNKRSKTFKDILERDDNEDDEDEDNDDEDEDEDDEDDEENDNDNDNDDEDDYNDDDDEDDYNEDNDDNIIKKNKHILQKKKNLNTSETNVLNFVQGDMNPTQRHTYTTWVSIDSQYREIIPPNPEDPYSNIKQLDKSTDFTFSLESPQKNVLKMSFYSIELSLAGYYVFSKEYNNLSFDISNQSVKKSITINEGNYTDIELIKEIQNELDKKGLSNIDISLNTNNNKVTFFDNSSSSDCGDTVITWYDDCSCNNNQKFNSTLGWALGFRSKSSSFQLIDSSCGLQADKIINLTGSKYLILEIDDFNRNRYTGNMISMSMPTTTNKFKIPEYARNIPYPICPFGNNITTAEDLSFPTTDGENNYIIPNKTDISAETFTRACRKGTHAQGVGFKGQDTLTLSQKITARELIYSSRIKTNLNQHYAPQSENILLRLPIERDPNNPHKNTIIYNFEGFDMSRKYYGPVTIEKLRVRLLDDKGRTIELNGGEISMSLLLEKLYQY